MGIKENLILMYFFGPGNIFKFKAILRILKDHNLGTEPEARKHIIWEEAEAGGLLNLRPAWATV